MPKRPPNDGNTWTQREIRLIKQLAKQNTPTRVVAKELGRTPAAVQQKAMREGISMRAMKSKAKKKQAPARARRRKKK